MPSAPTPLRAGMQLGDVRIEAPLGHGGMGSVWIGRHVQLNKRCAVKIAQPVPLPRTRAQRFLREAAALAQVDRHPGIVRIHAYGHDEETGVCYQVLELVEGRDLATVLEAGRLPLERTLTLGRTLAEALAHVHARGIVHRDLKPSNVVLRPSGAPVLIDFGLARIDDATRMTETGALVGTPMFMAPEQMTGDQTRVGSPADVFGLSAVLYTACTGQYPFQGDDLLSLMAATTKADPTPPSRIVPDLPKDLDQLILWGLAKDPADRPSASEVADALHSLASGERPVGLPVQRRKLGPILAGLGALVIGLGLTAAWFLPARRARQQLRAELAWQDQALGQLVQGETEALDEAARRAARVRDLAEQLPADSPGLGRALYVGARLSTLSGEASEPSTQGEFAQRLLLDALEARASGDGLAAQRRVKQLLGRESDHALGRRLRAELRADLDPQAAVTQAAQGEADARAVLAARWRELLAPLHRRAASSAESAACLAQVGPALGDAAPPEAVRAANFEAAEGVAEGWAAATVAARRDGKIEALLERLTAMAAACGEAPRLGPKLRAALIGVLRTWAVREDVEGQVLAVSVESELFYAVGGVGEFPAYGDLIANLTMINRDASMRAGMRFTLALTALRCDPLPATRDVIEGTDVQLWRDWVRRRPGSKAGRLGLILFVLNREVAMEDDLIPMFEDVFEAGLLDLHPKHEGWAYRRAVEVVVERAIRGDPFDERARDWIERAKELLQEFPHDLAGTLIQEGILKGVGDPAAGAAAWPGIIETIRRLASETRTRHLRKQHGENGFLAGVRGLDAERLLAEAHTNYAAHLELAGRIDEALEQTQTSLGLQESRDPYNMTARSQARLLRIARKRRERERVAALLKEAQANMHLHAVLAVELVRGYAFLGRQTKARKVLTKALRTYPRDAELQELRQRLKD